MKPCWMRGTQWVWWWAWRHDRYVRILTKLKMCGCQNGLSWLDHLVLNQGGSDKITCSNYCWRCIYFTMAFSIEKRNTWLQQTLSYFKLFISCMESTSYILVETVLRPAAPRRFHGYWDWCEEEIARINNPPLVAAASGSVAVATSKLMTESRQLLVSSKLTDFDNLSSTVGVASNPSFPSRILSRTAWRLSLKLRDKILDEKPRFEATGGGCMHTLTRVGA